MENADLCCALCKKWLDNRPFSPSCQDVHICGHCRVNKQGSKCPLCLEETDQDHLLLDKYTAKYMQRTSEVCKVCKEVIRLADLRKHRELCKLPEKEEEGEGGKEDERKEEGEKDDDVKTVALPPEEEMNDAEETPEEVPVVSCPYHGPYGCLFQGTQEKLNWHLQTDACLDAKKLHSYLSTACQKYQEIQVLKLQIGALSAMVRDREQ